MKITDITYDCVQVPFPEEFHPTWYPGKTEQGQVIFVVRVHTDWIHSITSIKKINFHYIFSSDSISLITIIHTKQSDCKANNNPPQTYAHCIF